MAETPNAQIWLGRLVFVLLALAVIFVQLLPLDMTPDRWAAPDLLLAGTLAWVARRPDYAPVTVIAAIFLLTDLLYQRPPGLWAALVLVLSEVLRKRSRGIRQLPVMLEWASVGAGVIAVTLCYHIALAIVMVPQPPLGLTLIQTLMTVLVYPVVVIMAQLFFGVSRPAPGQVDALGHRL